MRIVQRSIFTNLCRLATIIVPSLLGAFSAQAKPKTCRLNGVEINLDNGAYTAGKTGMVVCTDEAGKIVREEEYRNGKHVGHDLMVNFNGEKVVRTVNERGNSDGLERVYSVDGKLVREESYRDGKSHGTRHDYFSSGETRAIAVYEDGHAKFEASYRSPGKLERLRCGERSLIPEDKSLCGFGGKTVKVELYGYKDRLERVQTLSEGKVLDVSVMNQDGKVVQHETVQGGSSKVTEMFPDGKLKIEAEYKGRVLHGHEREYHTSGKLIRHTVWDEGRMASEETFFLNGQPKERTSRKRVKDQWFIAREEFWDTGKLKSSGLFVEQNRTSSWQGYALDRWTYQERVGEHRWFFEDGTPSEVASYDFQGRLDGERKTFHTNGRLASQESYQAGTLRLKKAWDEKGTLLVDEEYFEDGSRKSHEIGKKPGPGI